MSRTPSSPARTAAPPLTQAGEETFERLYRQLNVQQRAAVDAIEGVVMVLAGPGTGKTQILAMRIAKILQETQMDPYNILCLTFTESGVAAMRKRLISIIGPAAYYVRIHTFHSFCNDIIQEYPEKFSFARELEVLSEVERVQLFEEIIDVLPGTSPLKPFGSPYLFLPELAANVQSLKAEHVDLARYREIIASTKKLRQQLQPAIDTLLAGRAADRTDADVAAFHQHVVDLRALFPLMAQHIDHLEQIYAQYVAAVAAAGSAQRARRPAITMYKNKVKRWWDQQQRRWPKQQALTRVYELYQEKLRGRGRYDYEDMILLVLNQFKTDEELLARYQEQFQYILVDEYQDTNGAQNETVMRLCQFHDNPNIFVVGDDKQSIYRFQGASLENLLFLYNRYREVAQVVVLQENYRSQQLLLDAASALIRHNKESIDRYIPGTTQGLHATREYVPQPIAVTCFDTVDTESYAVAKQIQQLIAQGTPPQEIAVLYRRNADAADFATVLLKLEVPIQLENGHNILEDITIQQLMGLLRYIHGHDGPGLWSILQYEFWQLRPLDVVKSHHYAHANAIDLFAVISSPAQLAGASVTEPEKLLAVARKLAAWQALLANRPLQDFVAHVVNESGLLRHALEHTVDHLDVLNCLTTFFNEIKQVNRRHAQLTLEEFLAHLDLLVDHGITLPAAPLQTKHNAVRLMTAHKSKGLEFEHVFMVRAWDHHWGNLRQHRAVPLPAGILTHDKIAGQENNEDERRLFYVAMTRAKKALYISYASRNTGGRESVPAIFLEEIPAQYKRVIVQEEIEDEAFERLHTVATQVTPHQHDGQLTAYLAGLLDRYVLSVTHLNNYLECPRIFYYRNLLRVPSVKTVHMAYGTAVHEALYDFCQAYQRGEQPRKADLLTSFAGHLKREVLTPQELHDTTAVGMQVLGNYFDEYGTTCSTANLLEYNFQSHGVHVDGIPITGKIDKIEIVDTITNQVRVVDYKTGNPDSKRSELKTGGAYHRQLVFYKLLCDGSPRFAYTMVSGEIDFIQKSPTTGRYIKQQYDITSADAKKLIGVIKDVWQEIHALKFLALDNQRFCGECEYCQLAAQGKLR